jgi:hypothetical protein
MKKILGFVFALMSVQGLALDLVPSKHTKYGCEQSRAGCDFYPDYSYQSRFATQFAQLLASKLPQVLASPLEMKHGIVVDGGDSGLTQILCTSKVSRVINIDCKFEVVNDPGTLQVVSLVDFLNLLNSEP